MSSWSLFLMPRPDFPNLSTTHKASAKPPRRFKPRASTRPPPSPPPTLEPLSFPGEPLIDWASMSTTLTELQNDDNQLSAGSLLMRNRSFSPMSSSQPHGHQSESLTLHSHSRWKRWTSIRRSSPANRYLSPESAGSRTGWSSRSSFDAETASIITTTTSTASVRPSRSLHPKPPPLHIGATRQPSTSTQKMSKHKRSTSLSDAAASLFGSATHSLGRQQTPPLDKPPANLNPNDRAPSSSSSSSSNILRFSLRRERPPKEKRPKFTLGSESELDLPTSPFHVPSTPLPPAVQEQRPRNPSRLDDNANRPPLLRRDALINEQEPTGRRRWTLASALNDEDVSDEGLVRELNRMRDVSQSSSQLPGVLSSSRVPGTVNDPIELEAQEAWGIWERRRPTVAQAGDSNHRRPGMVTETSESVSRSSLENTVSHASTDVNTKWLQAQRALLTCRDLIHTERRYLASLTQLISQETATPPPPLMMRYAEDLAKASEAVLTAMRADPSAAGVARAFVEREQEVEAAYVKWCGVVGCWFVDADGAATVIDDDKERSQRATRRSRRSSKVVDDRGEEADPHSSTSPPVSPLKRTVSTWRRSMPSIAGSFGLATTDSPTSMYAPWKREREKEQELSPTPSATRVQRKPAVRDLAILPTQRVMRYVLLYRDLLVHTPSSCPSRQVIQRAIDVATRIADKCDRAQGNAAFVASSRPTTPVPSPSRRASARPATASGRVSLTTNKGLVSKTVSTSSSTSSSASSSRSDETTASSLATSVSASDPMPEPPGVKPTISLNAKTDLGPSKGEETRNDPKLTSLARSKTVNSELPANLSRRTSSARSFMNFVSGRPTLPWGRVSSSSGCTSGDSPATSGSSTPATTVEDPDECDNLLRIGKKPIASK